jgi:hypothetical protein
MSGIKNLAPGLQEAAAARFDEGLAIKRDTEHEKEARPL